MSLSLHNLRAATLIKFEVENGTNKAPRAVDYESADKLAIESNIAAQIIALDRLASEYDIDVSAAIQRSFNEQSAASGLPVFIREKDDAYVHGEFYISER